LSTWKDLRHTHNVWNFSKLRFLMQIALVGLFCKLRFFLFWVEVGWKYPQKLTCLYLFTSSMYITYKNWHLCKWVYLSTKVPILICSVLKLHSHMILRILMVCSLTLTFFFSFLFKCHILCTKDHEQWCKLSSKEVVQT